MLIFLRIIILHDIISIYYIPEKWINMCDSNKTQSLPLNRILNGFLLQKINVGIKFCPDHLLYKQSLLSFFSISVNRCRTFTSMSKNNVKLKSSFFSVWKTNKANDIFACCTLFLKNKAQIRGKNIRAMFVSSFMLIC